MANQAWLNLYKEFIVENFPIIGSDHGLIFLYTNPNEKNK